MSRSAVFGLLGVLAASSVGCSGIGMVVTNDSDYHVSVLINGAPQTFRFPDGIKRTHLERGETARMKIAGHWNGYAHITEASIVFKAWTSGGTYVGSASRYTSRYQYVSTPGFRPAALTITNEMFNEERRGYYAPWQ